MLSKTYDALVAAVRRGESRAAAEELAAYETRFGKIDGSGGAQVDARSRNRRVDRW